MKVYVLMEDGGAEGDVLLGVYESRERAETEGKTWAGGESVPLRGAYRPYVVEAELGAKAKIHEEPL